MAQASYTDSRWWNAYVGIPYATRGRSHAGADCWGLVRLVYQEQFATALPSFVDDYAHSADPAVEELAAREREGWEPVQGEPAEGDVLLFRMAGRLAHVGVAIGGGQFLHAREGHAATIERLTSGSWKHRVAGAYRYRAQPGALTLAGCPHPLRSVRLEAQYPAGASLGQVVQWVREQAGTEVQSDLVLMLDGKVIPAELWDSTTTVPGQRIEYRALPRGNTGRMLLMLAVSIVAIVVAPYLAPVIAKGFGVSAAVASGIAAAGLNFAGALLVNAIAPVRPPKDRNPGQAERQNLLQGGSNQANPYGAIPVVLGRVRFTAPLGAAGYAEAASRAAYLRMLLVWGYGPLQISDLRIGATPLETLEEVQQETLTGLDDTAEDLDNFNRLYGKDVSQQYFGTELQCIERVVASAVRAANVVSVTTTAAHTYSSGQEVSLYLVGAPSITGTITVTGATTFTFPHTGASETLAATVVRMQPWTEHVIADECDSIGVALHFPEGLRRMPAEGSNAGKVDPAAFRGQVQVRQLNPDTLAPLTAWGDVDKLFPGAVSNLQGAWFNTDADEELEPVYRWTRFSLDAFNNLVVRHGAFTTNPASNPTGTLLLRQQQAAFGVGVTYDRLPAYGPGEEGLWDVCMFGNAVHQTVDRRDATITGAALSISGFVATIASATVPRADSETLRYGAEGEPYCKRKDAFTTNISFAVAKGVYQVRARRTNDSTKEFSYPSGNKGQRFHTCQLLTITGYENRRPVIQPPGTRLAMTALRIRASNQLNGNVDGISATVQTICLDYDRTTSTWVQRPTRNPASLMRYVLQHPGNAQRVADSGLDLPALVQFHDYCRTNQFMFDTVITQPQSLLDTLRDICAAGRASPTLRDGQWTVVIDRPRSSIAQHFTPHNSWGFEGQRALPKLPHAFRVQFANSERGYQPDEMIVYNDGYSAANATLFEGLQLPGVTTRRAIFKHARFHLAQLKLRPETYTLNADIEHLICQRGDLVRVSHDVPLWGLGSGRIKNRISATVLELDEALPMSAGVQYTIRIRPANGTSITRTVAAVALDGHYSTITLTTSVTTAQGEPGNLFLFGSLGAESVELVVQAIEPAENMSARLTLVDYSPAVYDSDTEVVPEFDSQITLPPTLLQSTITAVPTISAIVSDERAMEYLGEGRYAYRISVAFTNPASLPASVSGVEGQIDYAGDTSLDWSSTTLFKSSDRAVLFTDVEKGAQYRLRLRYVGDDGRAGPWTTTRLHTVSGKYLPPGRVGAIAVSVEGTRLRLDWPDNSEADVVAYEVRTTDAGWGDSARVFRGAVSTCTVASPAAGVSTTWYVRAIDATGLYSETSRSVSYLSGAPPNVASITESFYDTSTTSASVTLDWPDVVPTFGLAGYRVSYDGVVRSVSASTITLPANWLGDRTFLVQTVDLRGNVSSGTSKTIAKLRPAMPTGVRAQVIDNTVMLYWTPGAPTTLPVSHTLLKKGSTWAAAEVLGRKDGAFTTINELAGGNFRYWLATVDTDGYESTPVAINAIVSQPPDFVFQGAQASSFTGTLSSAVVEQGAVLLPVNTTETWESHFTSRGWAGPADQVAAGFPLFIQPTPASGFYQEVFDFGTLVAGSRVVLNFSGDAVAGAPVATPRIELSADNVSWTLYDGVSEAFGTNFRYVRVRITVAQAGTETALYRLTALEVELSTKLKSDAGRVDALAGDALGTVANFNTAFIDAESITVTASGTTPVNAVYNFKDAVLSGTYSISGGVATVNVTAHELVVGQAVRLNFTTGAGVPLVATVVSVPTANSFTAAVAQPNTSGNLSIYWQGLRVYLFNTSGARVSGSASWAVRGY